MLKQISYTDFLGVKYLAEHFLEQVWYLQQQNFTPKIRFSEPLEVRTFGQFNFWGYTLMTFAQ